MLFYYFNKKLALGQYIMIKNNMSIIYSILFVISPSKNNDKIS